MPPKNKKKTKGYKKKKVMPNYPTRVTTAQKGGIIRPQNNVPKESIISLRYKQSIDIMNLPVYVDANNFQSGFGLVVNMSDPLSDGLIQTSFGSQTLNGSFALSNSATSGGQDNLRQAFIGKQQFPVTGKSSANSVIDLSIDYEIVCCERRITNNDAMPRALPGRFREDL